MNDFIRLNRFVGILSAEALGSATTGIRDALAPEGAPVRHPDPVAAGARTCFELYRPTSQDPSTTEHFGLSYGLCYQFSYGLEDINHRAGAMVAFNLWNRRLMIPVHLDFRIIDRPNVALQFGGDLTVGVRYYFNQPLMTHPSIRGFVGADLSITTFAGGDSGSEGLLLNSLRAGGGVEVAF